MARVITVVEDGKQTEKFIATLPNIRSIQGFMKGQWDLSVYDSCFPRKNRLGDVDGSVEQNGHTLHVEFKESKYSMTQGQMLKAYRQAKYSGIFTLFVIGKTDQPKEYIFVKPNDLTPDSVPCDTESLKLVMADWSKWTEANNLIENRTAEWAIIGKYFRSGEA